jgi:hypothetical protein
MVRPADLLAASPGIHRIDVSRHLNGRGGAMQMLAAGRHADRSRDSLQGIEPTRDEVPLAGRQRVPANDGVKGAIADG